MVVDGVMEQGIPPKKTFRASRPFFLSALAFSVLTAASYLVTSLGYLFTFDAWTRIPATLWFFSLAGLSLTVALFLRFRSIAVRILIGVAAAIGLYAVSVIAILTSANVRVVEAEGYVLYVSEERFLFNGEDTYYLKEGFLLEKRIASARQGEDCSSTARIEDGRLVLVESWYDGEEERSYPLE